MFQTMPLNFPILLTWLRIVAIPLLIAAYYLPVDWATSHERDLAATSIFVAAAFTDRACCGIVHRLVMGREPRR